MPAKREPGTTGGRSSHILASGNCYSTTTYNFPCTLSETKTLSIERSMVLTVSALEGFHCIPWDILDECYAFPPEPPPVVEPPLPPKPGAQYGSPRGCSWYHADLDRKRAEIKLKKYSMKVSRVVSFQRSVLHARNPFTRYIRTLIERKQIK